MTDAEIQRLESLAREATPGPWRQDYKKFSHVYPTGQNSAMSKPIAVVNGGTHTGTAANAAYIAAANPADRWPYPGAMSRWPFQPFQFYKSGP